VAGLFCSWGKESRASKREVRACGGGLKASHELAEGTSVAVIMIGNLLFTQRIPRPAKILPRDSSGRSIMAATLPDRPGRTPVGERRHSLCDAQTTEGTKLSLERALSRPALLHRH
jgi:hypothetical protein